MVTCSSFLSRTYDSEAPSLYKDHDIMRVELIEVGREGREGREDMM
jgi:hypothetical protein